MVAKKPSFIRLRLRDNNGITIVGLIAFMVCLAIIVMVSLLVLRAGKRAAYEITAKHDLRLFIDTEEAYYAENEEYRGDEGDVISNVPDKASTFSLEGFTPSEGVIITVISANPFIVTSKHVKAKAVFEYNFEERILKKR